jgi:glycerophosphoryl diester phosphodiesterase
VTGGRPLVVAHRGNRPRDAAAAARTGADLVEVDVHMRWGAVEVRHARRWGPVLWDRESLRLARGPSVALGAVVSALGSTPPLLDLKGGSAALAPAALAAARGAGAREVAVSSRRWDLVDAVAGEPGVHAVHSAAGRRELARLRRRLAGRSATLCLRRDLLSERLVRSLGDEGAAVWTWPVEGLDDARRLAGWGVAGLVCDDQGLVEALVVGSGI